MRGRSCIPRGARCFSIASKRFAAHLIWGEPANVLGPGLGPSCCARAGAESWPAAQSGRFADCVAFRGGGLRERASESERGGVNIAFPRTWRDQNNASALAVLAFEPKQGLRHLCMQCNSLQSEPWTTAAAAGPRQGEASWRPRRLAPGAGT